MINDQCNRNNYLTIALPNYLTHVLTNHATDP